ncbi:MULTISPECIES: hypothetical protein [Streptomyces]
MSWPSASWAATAWASASSAAAERGAGAGVMAVGGDESVVA